MKSSDELLEVLFNPRSIAVVGVSKTPGKIGHEIMNNIIRCGFRGPLYPISHKYAEVQDIRCYRSVLDVTDDVDLAIVLTPEDYIPKVLEELGAKGVKVAVISSGSRRGSLVERITVASERYSMRVLGPSSLGIYYSKSRLNATPISLTTEGGVALISESKTLGISMVSYGLSEGIEFSTVIGTGGKADIRDQDLLEYLSEDDQVKSIVIHLEVLRDPKAFMDGLKNALRKKPIIVLTGSREILKRLEPMKKELPILKDFTAALDLSVVFTGRRIEGRRVLILTNSSGAANLLVGSLEGSGIELPVLSETFLDDIRMFIPEGSSSRNPLDLTSDASPEIFRGVIESSNLHSDEFDFIILVYCETNPTELDKFRTMLVELKDLVNKPLIPVLLGGDSVKKVVKELRKEGVPSYYSIGRTVRASDSTIRYLLALK
ncbi:MAG: CoA-binding protein [Candidatus Korarchaeum sp.]|nr:CoA-binding protein [Candidatus Korarchaeum sp.]MDW8035003.1 CoA-binding protein [Candidatus Korarchaeum sp.]